MYPHAKMESTTAPSGFATAPSGFATAPSRPLLKLSDDTLRVIFSFLAFDDLARARLVCLWIDRIARSAGTRLFGCLLTVARAPDAPLTLEALSTWIGTARLDTSYYGDIRWPNELDRAMKVALAISIQYGSGATGELIPLQVVHRGLHPYFNARMLRDVREGTFELSCPERHHCIRDSGINPFLMRVCMQEPFAAVGFKVPRASELQLRKVALRPALSAALGYVIAWNDTENHPTVCIFQPDGNGVQLMSVSKLIRPDKLEPPDQLTGSTPAEAWVDLYPGVIKEHQLGQCRAYSIYALASVVAMFSDGATLGQIQNHYGFMPRLAPYTSTILLGEPGSPLIETMRKTSQWATSDHAANSHVAEGHIDSGQTPVGVWIAVPRHDTLVGDTPCDFTSPSVEYGTPVGVGEPLDMDALIQKLTG